MKKAITKTCLVTGGLIPAGLFIYVFATVEMPILLQFFSLAFSMLSIKFSVRKFSNE